MYIDSLFVVENVLDLVSIYTGLRCICFENTLERNFVLIDLVCIDTDFKNTFEKRNCSLNEQHVLNYKDAITVYYM
jgi:hypothetical protein